MRSRGFFATRTPCGMQAAPSPVPQDRSLMRPGCYPESLRSSRWFRVRVFHTLTLAYMSNSLVRVSRRDDWYLAGRYPQCMALRTGGYSSIKSKQEDSLHLILVLPKTSYRTLFPIKTQKLNTSRPFSFHQTMKFGWGEYTSNYISQGDHETTQIMHAHLPIPPRWCRWQPSKIRSVIPSPN